MPEQELNPTSPSAPAGADYFSVFDLPRMLALDDAALTPLLLPQEQGSASRPFLPRPMRKNSSGRLNQTSLLNDAYRALKDPIARTEYLLRTEGITLVDDARAEGMPDKQAKKKRTAGVAGRGLRAEYAARRDAHECADRAKTTRSCARIWNRRRAQFEAQFQAIESQIQGQWDPGGDAALAAGDQPAGKTQSGSYGRSA